MHTNLCRPSDGQAYHAAHRGLGPCLMRMGPRNLPFLVLAVGLGAACGAAWAHRGPALHVASVTGQVGLRFLGKPLEAQQVAEARLLGAVRSRAEVVRARAVVHDDEPSQPFELSVWAQSATVAEAAAVRGAQAVVAEYQAWHAREVAGQERVRHRFLALGARLEASESLAPGAFTKEAQLNAERLNGTQLVLQALAEGVPALQADVRVRAADRPQVVTTALIFAGAMFLWALFIILLPLNSTLASVKAGLWVALCAAAGLYQAQTASPSHEAQAVLRMARWDGQTLPATPPARPKLLAWVAVETGKGAVPNSVRFSLQSGRDPSEGLFTLAGLSDDPERLRSMLHQTTEFMRAWHDAGVRGQEGRVGRELRRAQDELRQQAHAAADPQVHRRASDLILHVAHLERVLSPLRSSPSVTLQAPVVRERAHDNRTVPYLLLGLLCGMVLAVMGRRWL